MEKLQVPINPCLIGEDLDVGWLEEFVSRIGSDYTFEDTYSEERVDTLSTTNYTLLSLEDKMPFLQMLQGVEAAQTQQIAPASTTNPYPFMQEPSFQLLLRLQHQKMMLEQHQGYECNFTSPTTELESCVTTNNNNEMMMEMDMHSPVKSENCRGGDLVVVHHAAGDTTDLKCSATDLNQRSQVRSKRAHLSKSSNSGYNDGVSVASAAAAPKEKRKRKRPVKPAKNKQEAESQRMTHIAVERNRRRLMNDHLSALRSLMPPSYVQRGDQASIIGGAIDFVKELEQLHQSLQAQKRMRQSEENGEVSTTSPDSSSNFLNNMIMTSISQSPFQLTRNINANNEEVSGDGDCMEATRKLSNNVQGEELSAENRSTLADIKVVVIQNHVNLKILCQRRPGQLLKAIVAFEELRLTIFHLNITSLHTLVHYSFNLKMEDDCNLRSADEVARAVQQIFSLINLPQLN